MSFYSDYVAEQTGQDEPVAGPKSPHAARPHHGKPEPPNTTSRVVMHPEGKHEVNEAPPAKPAAHRIRFFGKDK